MGESDARKGKRPREEEAPAAAAVAAASDSDDAEDVGPAMPPPADGDEMGDWAGPDMPQPVRKKQKVLEFEQAYLDALPSAEMYEKSYNHRDVVTHVVSTSTNFIITASCDGHIKFWKKQSDSIEFVKHYRGHLGRVVCMAASANGELLCTVAEDKTLKVFDVVNFDMINMIDLDFVPSVAEWIFERGSAEATLAVADAHSPHVHIFDGRGDGKAKRTVQPHRGAAVQLMKFNAHANVVVSSDERGGVEYWDARTFAFPRNVRFSLKSESDLYEFQKCKTTVRSLELSRDGRQFVTMGADRFVRVFWFATGKLRRKYDESLQRAQDVQAVGGTHSLENFDFGRRLAVEQTIDAEQPAQASNAVFDESGHFVLYPCILGIKVVNIHTNKVTRILGRGESAVRFCFLALYQGRPDGDVSANLLKASTELEEVGDPTLLCTGHRRKRFYLFTRREPNEEEDDARDVFNEKPTAEDVATAVSQAGTSKLANKAVLRTSMGDIHVDLFAAECPRTIENFVGHARSGYYNKTIFHRVIKSFMLQGGDPEGDGTGGESIWGGEFEDEFVKTLRHDRPGVLSMANAGPNSNGSQFFVTTVACPWLDNKHTVFGRVTKGMDVVHAIEGVKTDKSDKPLEDVVLLNVDADL